MLDKGAIALFLEVIRSDAQLNVKEQAIWALGNIAGDENFFRNQILKAGAIQPVLAVIMHGEADSQFLRNSIWCLANMVRGKPMPGEDDLLSLIPVVSKVLENCSMEEILIDGMWCLSYCSDAGQRTVPNIMETGITPRIV